LQKFIRAWFVKNHGEGDERQHDFYRCDSCAKLITWKTIRKGGCQCGGFKIKPTNPSFVEKIKIMVLPWTIS